MNEQFVDRDLNEDYVENLNPCLRKLEEAGVRRSSLVPRGFLGVVYW